MLGTFERKRAHALPPEASVTVTHLNARESANATLSARPLTRARVNERFAAARLAVAQVNKCIGRISVRVVAHTRGRQTPNRSD